MSIAGMMIFAAVMMLIFVLLEDKETAMIMMMPLTLIFGALGILDSSLTVILLIVSVVFVAMKARKAWSVREWPSSEAVAAAPLNGPSG